MTAALRPSPRQVTLLGWLGAVLLTAFSFVVRWHRIDEPHSFAFDETYYAKDAWSLWHHGYVRSYVEGADERILAGETAGLWTDDPSMVVHPEVGKWLIALGEAAGGMDPGGWRLASAVVGSLIVLVMVRLALRVTGSQVLSLLAGLLLALDGLHLVLSRIALLDIFLAFFLLCGVHAVVADRQWFRSRLATGAGPETTPQPVAGWGPRVLLRPWLLLAGIFFGLAVGTKWTALYPLAAFGLLVWAWSAGARRGIGVSWPVLRSALVDGVPAFVQLVLVAAITYTATWTGWLINAEEYERTLSSTQYTTHDGGEAWPTASEPDAEGLGEVVQSLRSLFYYHQDVFTFHTEFLNEATHSYASKPAGWLLLNRPVGVDAQLDIQPGEQGCEAVEGSTCLRVVTLLGNPVLWWAGCAALVLGLVRWVGARDWRAGVAVVGVGSTWLPWLQYDDRTIFLFYAIASLPFLVLAVVLAIGHLLGTHPGPSPRRTVGAIITGTFLVGVVLAFWWFYPVWTDQLITHGEWVDRMWFTRWI